MKKATIGLCTVVVTGGLAGMAFGGASVITSENFDGYEAGVAIIDVTGPGSEFWTAWDDTVAVGQGLVSTAFSRSLPNSLECDATPDDDLIHLYTSFGLTSGVYRYTTHVYAPSTATGSPFFILMNNYNDGGNPTGSKSWSTQVSMSIDDGVMTDTGPSAATADFPLDEWVELQVVINLDVGNDVADIDGATVSEGRQEMFVNGELFYSGVWLGHISGPGSFRKDIQALDYYSNVSGPIYMDDILLEQLPPDGACCATDGSCVIAADETTCVDGGGFFSGSGSTCAGSTCFVQDADGAWELDFSGALRTQSSSSAGFVWGGAYPRSTCGLGNTCDLSSSEDIAFKLIVPEDAEYIISICGADFDTVLSLGTTACSNDIAEEDDSPGCGTASEIRMALTAGTYYATVEGFGGGSCGVFGMNIRELCPELPAPGGKTYIETEACGDDANGGCNMAVPAFEPLLCDSINRGTAWTDGAGTRDTDWWQLIVTETTGVTMTGISERVSTVFGIINSGGSGDCVDATAVNPAVAIGPCWQDTPALVEASLAPGTWWFFVATQFGSPVAIDCDDLDTYEFSLVCGDSCVPSPDGDINDDGFTDFTDLVTVLAQWGTAGSADADCDGSVGFTDLLLVLSNWNPAP